MKDTLSKRDWETISAYLDGQLSQRKQDRLKTRLQNNHQLQVALDELRSTRHILGITPRLTAPRDFMLTPEMAGSPIRMPQLSPVFGWASALASFLLILVLVGDIFGAGGFLPDAYNISQQDEFIAPRSQVVEDIALTQPSVTGEMEIQLKESVEEVASLEVQENDTPLEAAAAPVMESAPVDESATGSKEIEEFSVAEETIPEKPDERAGTTAGEEFVLETPSDATLRGDGEETVTEEGTDIQFQRALISETVDIAALPEQPTEIPTEEESTQPQEEQAELSPTQVPESFPTAQPLADPAEQLPDNQIEMPLLPEPTPLEDWIESETMVLKDPPPEKTRDIIFGVEVILALCALGTGLAWIFIRRRGG